MPDRRLIVASTNANKIREVQLALGESREWIAEPLPLKFPEIEESGATFLENAILKAAHYSQFVDALTLADDSGLCVRALHGRPGVYTARYGPTTEAQNQRVLDELDATGGTDRHAEFSCAFAIALSGTIIWKIECSLEGEIAPKPVGLGGFGFDSIFYVPALRKTLAELTALEKNQVSARGKALVELRNFLAGW
jgi:non-canonical purine NTP pyrophosphatase (RdgB/HAM1 family)